MRFKKEIVMTSQKSFVKPLALLFYLLILASSSFRVVNGQKEQQVERPGGATDKYVIIEGDIQVSPSFYQELVRAARSPQSAPIKFPTKLWPNGIIPFQFETTCAPTSNCAGALPSGCVSAANQTAMLNAMAVLEAVANVDFQQCANNICSGNFVRIRDTTNDTTVGDHNVCVADAANNSWVGVQGGMQDINIVSWGRQFVIVHELLHCLGFIHEQSRPDRDHYVEPVCENVEGGCDGDKYKNNFRIKSDATSYGYYDFDSVMHYGQCSFSVHSTCPNVNAQVPDGGITLRVTAPYAQWQNLIGQRNHLSALDRASVSFLYPASDWRFLDTTYTGGYGSPNGSFYRPYTSFAEAVANTPEGGTIWLLRTQAIPAVGTYGKQITVKAAPGVDAILGG
jgi:hypothetical protein